MKTVGGGLLWTVGLLLLSCTGEPVEGTPGGEKPQALSPSTPGQGRAAPAGKDKKKVRAGAKAAAPQEKQPSEKGRKPGGRFRSSRGESALSGLPPWQQEQQKQLQALGYVQGSQKASDRIGIVAYDKVRAYPGVNLYNSGHAPSAYLMDMEGNVLHEWHYDFFKAFPEEVGHPVENEQRLFWRRVHLLENGDLLAIYEGIGMIKIDRDSNLVWRSFFKHHHAIEVQKNGDIYTLTRRQTLNRTINPKDHIYEDYVNVTSRDGIQKQKYSVVEAMERFPEKDLFWNRAKHNKGDLFHTNAVQVLDGSAACRHPAFKKGNVLISMRHISAVFVLDVEKEAIVWGYKSDFNIQHEPRVLPNKNLILFDNVSRHRNSGESRILEYELPEMNVAWSYEGTKENPFFSGTCGTVQRLRNGNTLITETDNGRAFEVTPEKETVWEFVSPHRAGAKNELVASLFELKRFPKSYVKWLKKQ